MGTQRVCDLFDLVDQPGKLQRLPASRLNLIRSLEVTALALSQKFRVDHDQTSTLDVSIQVIGLELLQQIQKEQQFATLLISHDLAVVDLLSDRISVMQFGEIVEQGEKDQILRNPQDEYTKKLIAAVPVPDPKEQRQRREARRS